MCTKHSKQVSHVAVDAESLFAGLRVAKGQSQVESLMVYVRYILAQATDSIASNR